MRVLLLLQPAQTRASCARRCSAARASLVQVILGGGGAPASAYLEGRTRYTVCVVPEPASITLSTTGVGFFERAWDKGGKS